MEMAIWCWCNMTFYATFDINYNFWRVPMLPICLYSILISLFSIHSAKSFHIWFSSEKYMLHWNSTLTQYLLPIIHSEIAIPNWKTPSRGKTISINLGNKEYNREIFDVTLMNLRVLKETASTNEQLDKREAKISKKNREFLKLISKVDFLISQHYTYHNFINLGLIFHSHSSSEVYFKTSQHV